MNTYLPTIGLEIHAELKTRTKMFCDSANDPHAAEPNTHVCPVCMAFPGTLPVVNRQAVLSVLRVGTALGGALADYTEFDRKNYFYPDLPKGYQISQYKHPLVKGGSLCGVVLTRIHLEEDTARSQHGEGEWSLIDFNRAGVPLMELVTEPVIHEAKVAAAFAEELQLVLRVLGVSDANMEKGEMRVEANISVSRESDVLGTKVEVKNLNSFRSVERAIDFEIQRHKETLEKGGRIVQETRGWDENKQETFSQRLKEESHDYRYFPDPDIPKFHLSRIPEMTREHIVSSLPELPWERRLRYTSVGLKASDAEVFVRDSALGDFFDVEVLAKTQNSGTIQRSANYLLSDVRGTFGNAALLNLSSGRFFSLIMMIEGGSLSSRGAKDVLKVLSETGASPESIAEELGVLQVEDIATLTKYAKEVLRAHPEVAREYKEGKESALQFLVGQGMRLSKGAAHPGNLARYIKEELK